MIVPLQLHPPFPHSSCKFLFISSYIITKTTRSVPGPPTNVQAYNTSSTSINITWDLVPHDSRYENISAYEVTIRVTKDNSTMAQLVYEVMISPCSNINSMSWHQTGLNKYTPYTISVAGMTHRAFTNASDGITVLTGEDGEYFFFFFFFFFLPLLLLLLAYLMEYLTRNYDKFYSLYLIV